MGRLPRNNSWSEYGISIAAILMAIGIILTIALTFQTPSYHDPKSPSFFPLLLAYLLLGCGTLLGLRAMLSKTTYANESKTEKSHYGRGALGVVILVLYGIGVFHIGFWLASTAAIIALTLLLNEVPLSNRFIWKVVMIGLIVPAVVALAFDIFAGVKMPELWGMR